MSNGNSGNSGSVRFRVPQQTLEKLSFSGRSPKKMAAWVDALPRANLGETARLLYSGLQELNQLRIDTVLRFKLLEVVRPAVYYVCDSLRKHYLNQPIILPEKASKVANLAQALQTHLANGYKIIVVQNLSKMELSDCRQQVGRAAHRAISDLTSTLNRCYQLYFPTPASLWQELNGLYELAEKYGFLDLEMKDGETQFGSIRSVTQVYQRACLLATTKTNQLRQNEIAQLYQLSVFLAPYITISNHDDDSYDFVVNLGRNLEPLYRGLLKQVKSDKNRFFDCSSLIAQLRRLRSSDNKHDKNVQIAKSLSSELTQHLEQVWSVQKQRSFTRTDQKGGVEIAFGMTIVHYYLANGQEFDDVLRGGVESITEEDENPFGKEKDTDKNLFKAGGREDVWSHAFDAASGILDVGQEGISVDPDSPLGRSVDKRDKYGICSCQLVNTSPGGYCINLPNTLPGTVKTGELLVIREGSSSRWNLGVIRWAKRFSKENVRIGVELIASQANSVGVKLLQKTGDMGNFMRALLVPELKALEQPMTILVPNIAFQESSKVLVNQYGSEIKIQLMKQVAKTASFSQFELKVLSPNQSLVGMESEKDDDEDDFDTIWSSL